MPWPGTQMLRDLRSLGVPGARILRMAAWTVLFAVFEGIGLGLLLPVLEYAERGAGGGAARPAVLDTALGLAGLDARSTTLPWLLLLAFVPLLLRAVLHYARDLEAARVKVDVAASLRRRGVAALLHASRDFLAAHGRGELYGALTVEADRAAEAMATRLVFATALALATVYVLLLVLLSPALALCTVPAIALLALGLRAQRAGAAPLGVVVSERNSALGLELGDALGGIERVKLRAAEADVARALGDIVEAIRSGLLRIERLRILVETCTYPVAVAAAFTVVWVAVGLLGMSLASLGLFLFVLVRLVPQATLLNSMWSAMHGCMASFTRLDALLRAAESAREDAGGTLSIERLASGIRFADVSFRYPGASAPALREVSFEVACGSLVAVAGRSGAGKSTLVRLLAGFHAPEAGAILLDGVALERYARASLRRAMAVVPEDPFLFHGTVRDNLVFGLAPAPSPDDLARALEQSHAAAFVARLAQRLDTPLGERGALLSQGQRQRLAIAHALLVHPAILVLDEPTSALDGEAEEAIRETIARQRGRTTTIVIAHRLATIREADTILLLDDGRLVAQGTHDELLASSALYRQLFEGRARE